MLYSAVLKQLYRTFYGEPPDLPAGEASQGLVLIADGVGGLDLCGTGLRYVMGVARPAVLRAGRIVGATASAAGTPT